MVKLTLLSMIAISCTALANVQKNLSATAKLQKFTLVFDKTQLQMVVENAKEAQPAIQFSGVRMKSKALSHLIFLTPQTAADDKIEIPASLLRNFKGMQTLEQDIKDGGFEATPHKRKLKRGMLYFWYTPTYGASVYYYLQNPADKKMAVKIGPMAVGLTQEVDLQWDQARWSNLER